MSTIAEWASLGKKQPLHPGLKSNDLQESNRPSNHNWCINRSDLLDLRGELFRVRDGVLLLRIIYLVEGCQDPSLVSLAKEVLAYCHQIRAEFTCVTWRWISGTVRSVNVEQKTLSPSAWRCACPAPAETWISNQACKNHNSLEKEISITCLGCSPQVSAAFPS